MTLKNVEKIETQEKHEQSWFQRFRNKFGATAVVATGVVATTGAHAEVVIPDFLAPATTALDGIGVGLGALFLVAIGIVCVIIAFTTTKGGVKRAG